MDFHPQGGYVIGGDPATAFPDLWAFMVNDWGVRSVLDLGCGEGHALRFFESLGCEVQGIDLIPQPHPKIRRHDFEAGRVGKWDATLNREFDLLWTCEFVEHVSPAKAHHLVPTFQSARRIAMTHAFPNQGGIGHVNCQTSEYWQGFMAAIGIVTSVHYRSTR